MTVRKRGSSFQADFMMGGVRYREPFSSYEEAERWERDARAALKDGKPVPRPKNGRTDTGAKLQTLGALYSHVRVAHWDHTKGGHTAVLNAEKCIEYLGRNRLVSEIDTLVLEEMANYFSEEGNTHGTINRKLSAMSKMLTCALDYGIISRKPKIPKRKELNGQVRYLTEADERRRLDLMAHLGLNELADFQTFQIDTGMRLGETMRFKWDHLSPDWDKLSIWETKANTARTIFLTDRVKAILERVYTAETQGPFTHMRSDNMLRTSYRRQWTIVNEKEGVDRRIHDLRHTCASRLVQRGIDLMRVKAWMGHKNFQTTLIYAHLAPNDLAMCKEALRL